MQPVLVQHIDSVIQIVVGVFFTWAGFRSGRDRGARTTKIFRGCGPALVVIGGLLLLRPQAAVQWHEYVTADQVAMAEFPGAARAQEATDTIGEVSVKRTSFTYDVPGKDIALFLSYSPLPADARALTEAQRVEGTIDYFKSQGFTVSQGEKDSSGSIHRLSIRQAAKKTTIRMALAYVGDNVYRTVASYTDGSEDPPLVDRFMASFRVSGSRPSPAP